MFSKTALVTGLLAATAPLASAHSFFNGIHAPKNLAPGQNFTVTVSSESTTQQIENILIVFGLTPAGTDHAGILGNEVLRETYLGPWYNDITNDSPFSMYVPANFTKGEAVLTVSTLSLTSEYHAPNLDFFNVTVNVGDMAGASDEIVSGEKATSVFYGFKGF